MVIVPTEVDSALTNNGIPGYVLESSYETRIDNYKQTILYNSNHSSTIYLIVGMMTGSFTNYTLGYSLLYYWYDN